MKEYDLDFSQYNYQQLVEALENVDIDQYPDNALEIYQRILDHLKIDYKHVTVETFGYEVEESMLGSILRFPFSNIFSSMMFADVDLTKNNLRHKITELNKLIEQKSLI